MKTLFVEAKITLDCTHLIENLEIPRKIGLVAAVQFADNLKDIKTFLEKRGKKIHIAGQVLGCNVTNVLRVNKLVDAFLFVGSMGFHPVEIARVTKKSVFVVNPVTSETGMITKQEIVELEKRKKGKLLKFLNARKVGILVTLKPGQENLSLASIIKSKLKSKEKYIFVGNEISELDLMNFKNIESWINTACQRIEIKNVVNFEDISNYLDK